MVFFVYVRYYYATSFTTKAATIDAAAFVLLILIELRNHQRIFNFLIHQRNLKHITHTLNVMER